MDATFITQLSSERAVTLHCVNLPPPAGAGLQATRQAASATPGGNWDDVYDAAARFELRRRR